MDCNIDNRLRRVINAMNDVPDSIQTEIDDEIKSIDNTRTFKKKKNQCLYCWMIKHLI